jgi:hypothetical protein
MIYLVTPEFREYALGRFPALVGDDAQARGYRGLFAGVVLDWLKPDRDSKGEMVLASWRIEKMVGLPRKSRGV